jgi:hypothetical protein
LPTDIKTAVDAITREEGISPNDLVRDALRQYLLLRRFRRLGDRMVPSAEAQGILTDQDIFDRVS